jgi:streptomycin 6-kinase
MRRRVVIAAEAAGIDVDEAFAWTLLRAGIEVSWAVGMDDPDDVTLFIALTKALDD